MFEGSDWKEKFWYAMGGLFLIIIGGLVVAMYYETASSEHAYKRLSKEAEVLQKTVTRLKELEKEIDEGATYQAGKIELFSKLLATHPYMVQRYRRDVGEWGFNVKENCPPGKSRLPAPSSFEVEVSIKVTIKPQISSAFD